MNEQPHPPPPRTTSPIPCSICLETLSENIAQLLPCTHTFDLPCTILLLTSPPSPQSHLCPLCRTPIAAVQHDFLSPNLCSTHVLGSSTFDSGLFIREDETVTEDMSEREKNRRRELRRLRLHEDYDPPFWKTRPKVYYVRENGKVVLVERVVGLKVVQKGGLETISIFTTKLRIWELEEAEGKLDEMTVKNSIQCARSVEDARKEVRELLEGFGVGRKVRAWNDFEDLELHQPQFKVLEDENGLEVTKEKGLVVHRRAESEDITISAYTSLTERFPATVGPRWGDDDFDSETKIVGGRTKSARMRAINLARQEIQGAFELFKQLLSGDVRDLDCGRSGILEPAREEDTMCEYCEVKHRNGDCKLPTPSELEETDVILGTSI